MALTQNRRDELSDVLLQVEHDMSSSTHGITDLFERAAEATEELKANGFDPVYEKERRRPAFKPKQPSNDNAGVPVTTKRKKGIAGVASVKTKDLVPWDDDTDLADWQDDMDLLDSGTSHPGKKSGKKWDSWSKGKTAPKCAHSHPLLTIAGLTIQGGSCYSPQHGPYDVEIRLCGGSQMPAKILPWDTTVNLRYPITDQDVPKNREEFEQLIHWTIDQMKAGKKVHVGCIGGHGRTGVFLSVLWHFLEPDKKDVVKCLREVYCKSAVESQKQVDWLHEHYGLDKVEPRHRKASSVNWTKEGKKFDTHNKTWGGTGGSPTMSPEKAICCIPNKHVWGKNRLI